jgi:hypothetical protein
VKGMDRSGLPSAEVKGGLLDFDEVMVMKDNQSSKQQSKSPKKRKKEKLSRKDVEELMGMNMDTYARHKGAIRRR